MHNEQFEEDMTRWQTKIDTKQVTLETAINAIFSCASLLLSSSLLTPSKANRTILTNEASATATKQVMDTINSLVAQSNSPLLTFRAATLYYQLDNTMVK